VKKVRIFVIENVRLILAVRNKVGWANVQITHVKNEFSIQDSVFPSGISLCASFPSFRFTQLKSFNKLTFFYFSMQPMGPVDFLVNLAT
jgi:hypothetical protein